MTKKVGNLAKAGLIAVATIGALFFAASPAIAASTTSAPVTSLTTPAGAQASADCYDIQIHGDRWTGWCQVYSGEVRTVTYCTNGHVSFGAWIGARPEPWFVYGDCPGSTVLDIGLEGRG